MGAYKFLRGVYFAAIPLAVRRLTHDRRYPFHKIVDPIQAAIRERFAEHDDIYDRDYYERSVEPSAQRSAPIMAKSILKELVPATVVDVGCGTGELLLALRDLGVKGRGLEYSKAALEIARSKRLDVVPFNLERPVEELPVYTADLVVSTEVAEHLPSAFADTYVEYLCRSADTVLVTAAIPGQGGTDHVNEQPNVYWIEKFASRGFEYHIELTMRLRHEWEEAGAAHFYARNLLIFGRGSCRLKQTGP
jgi:SAM-dependent methyltransferase